MYYFAVVQSDVDTFYTVGGHHDIQRYINKILKYEANVWTHVGDLQHARHLPAAALSGNQLWTFGGASDTFADNDAT